MHREQAVNVFDLVRKSGNLPAKIEELVPLSFMGSAAVKFYRARIEAMKQLGVADDQRKATLADGQDAGEMLLRIEARIGELAISTPRGPTAIKGKQGGASLEPPKHERLGMSRRRLDVVEAIHREMKKPGGGAVAAVIKEARENEDIPTKTAVLNKINTENAEAKLKAFREKHDREPRQVLSEYLEKSIEHANQINLLIGRYFDHPDQVDAERMKELMRQLRQIFETISERTRGKSWKQLA